MVMVLASLPFKDREGPETFSGCLNFRAHGTWPAVHSFGQAVRFKRAVIPADGKFDDAHERTAVVAAVPHPVAHA